MSPVIVLPLLAIAGGVVTIIIIVVLGFRSMNMDDIRTELRKATVERDAIEKHLEFIDGQNSRSIRRHNEHEKEISVLENDVKAVKEVVTP
jgi:hypothetical protein